jgi:hypothetical protein
LVISKPMGVVTILGLVVDLFDISGGFAELLPLLGRITL